MKSLKGAAGPISGGGTGDLSPFWFWTCLAAVLVAQAWIKFDLAPSEPFTFEQFRDWAAALQVAHGAGFPAYGPAMAAGPPLPGGWYYFLLSVPLRLDDSPLFLGGAVTVLYSLAAAYFAWRLSKAFNRAAALAVAALLSFHPIAFTMTSVIHNPDVAFSCVMVVFAALLSPRVGFLSAAAAGFFSIVAVQCHAMAVVVFTLPLAWILALAARDRRWSLSWAGYATGLASGGLGYLPFIRLQCARHFGDVVRMTRFRGASRYDFTLLVLKPLFFFLVQGAYEASSYFGAGWRGFVGYFRFHSPGDLWAFAATYSSFCAAVVLGLRSWRGAVGALREGRGAWRALSEPWNLCLYRLAMLSLPVWFSLSGRFSAAYMALFIAWSCVPAAAWIAERWAHWSPARRALLASGVLLACSSALALHQRIYAQRGADLGHSRYDYATLDAAAGLLGSLQPAKAAVVFADGNGANWCGKAVFGLAKRRHGWTGAPLEPSPVSAAEEKAYLSPGDWMVGDGIGLRGASAVWIGSKPLSPYVQGRDGWRLWRYVDGMYVFGNF